MKRYVFIKKSAFPAAKLVFLPKLLLCISPAAAAAVITLILKCSTPQKVESVYSSGLFRPISSALGAIGRIAPFSLASIILYLLSAAGIIIIIGFLAMLIFKSGRLELIKNFVLLLTAAVSIVFLLFTLLCAPNYYRVPFAEQAGYTLDSYTEDDLYDLCEKLIAKTNSEREKFSGTPEKNVKQFAQKTKAAFDSLSVDYPFIGKAKTTPKPFVGSEILSILNLTGFYFPYTGEANVNVHAPFVELPFTMCHELSHTRGFMLENEANFIGYLACKKSDDPVIRYSGYYVALIHSMNMMAQTDAEKFIQLRKQYSPAVESDAALLSEYWDKYFNTPAADFSNAVNDTYLKANDLSDGIKSYGRMVDLLMAEHLKEKGE
ncbi:MAG: DUF3810 domain-containing protein [Oscillospiraceae bacterium]|nr:DUF3810 domain-containing protein [Oscillospiraceae bacterium]